MVVKKKTKKPGNNAIEGDKDSKNSRLSETVQKWAAFLVANGASQKEAAERIRAGGLKISQQSVSVAYRAYFNKNSPFPIPTLTIDELIENSKKLLMLFQQEVFYQEKTEREWDKIGLNQKNLYTPIWEHEKLREDILKRDEILAIERIMKEEKLSEEALEILQGRYDRLNEELKG